MTDKPLQKLFDALRNEEASSLPSYARLVAQEQEPAHVATNLLVRRMALPSFAAAMIALWILVPRPSPIETEASQAFAPVRWAMPTDVLLSTPGSEFLRDVPTLGTDALLSDPLLESHSKWGKRG